MLSRILVFLTALSLAGPAFAAKLPPSEMENLAGETMHFPADFTGESTLVILAFAHEQREESARIAALLQDAQQKNPQLGWYELPIIDAPAIAHMFIRNGMREHTDAAMQPHVVPQFVDEDAWRKSSGMTSTEPLLAKIDHDGTILSALPTSSIQSTDDVLRFNKVGIQQK